MICCMLKDYYHLNLPSLAAAVCLIYSWKWIEYLDLRFNSLILFVKWMSWIHCLILQVNKACNFLQGWVIMRDTAALIETARAFATQLRWDARVVETESNSDERLLVCQKPFTKKL